MKTTLPTLVALASFIVFGHTDLVAVEIPDPELEAAVRAELGKPSGEITAADMESLVGLDASAFTRGGEGVPRIQSLEGLEAATNLEILQLQGDIPFKPSLAAEIDFSPLQNLSNLVVLDLRSNGLTSLDLPAGLTALTTLDLHNNQLTTLSLPADLTSLASLIATTNLLTTVVVPAGLTALTEVDLRSNQITSLTLPPGLSNLTSLQLRDNELTSLVVPDGFSSLTTLTLGFNPLMSLTLSDGLDSLVLLELFDHQLPGLTLPRYLEPRIENGSLAVMGFPIEEITYSGELEPFRISGITLLPSQEIQLTVEGPAGNVTLVSSPDLRVWTVLRSFEKPSDPENVLVPLTDDPQFFRVRN